VSRGEKRFTLRLQVLKGILKRVDYTMGMMSVKVLRLFFLLLEKEKVAPRFLRGRMRIALTGNVFAGKIHLREKKP
jgi:hypothetical protein